MTRKFNSQFHCPNCNTWQTQESLFSRWIRNRSDLDSRKGYCVSDQDYWIHKFKTYGNRGFQCLMLVEIKTLGADLTAAQRDTLHIVNQFLRNRRTTPTKNDKYQTLDSPRVYSVMNQAKVEVRAFGMHVLRFSGLGPDDSAEIIWNKTVIDENILASLLRFDLDPDSLKPLDIRSHHIRSENYSFPLDIDD